MKYKIACVGKIKEDYFTKLIDGYRSMDIIPIRMDSSRDLMEMALINRALV